MSVLLLSYGHHTVIHGYTLCPISGHAHDPLWATPILGDMRDPGRRFCRRITLLAARYAAYSVNET